MMALNRSGKKYYGCPVSPLAFPFFTTSPRKSPQAEGMRHLDAPLPLFYNEFIQCFDERETFLMTAFQVSGSVCA